MARVYHSGKATSRQIERLVTCGIPAKAARLFSYQDAEALLRRNAAKQPLTDVAVVRNDAQTIANYRAMPYHLYLQTEWWKRLKAAAIRRARYQCQRCETRGALDVHHLTYERLGTEADEDLQALCRSCHEQAHDVRSSGSNTGLPLRAAREALES